jgi:hypothetical protein
VKGSKKRKSQKIPENLLLCHGIMPPYGCTCVLDFFQVCVRPPVSRVTIPIPFPAMNPSQTETQTQTAGVLIAEKKGPNRQKKPTEESKTPVFKTKEDAP